MSVRFESVGWGQEVGLVDNIATDGVHYDASFTDLVYRCRAGGKVHISPTTRNDPETWFHTKLYWQSGINVNSNDPFIRIFNSNNQPLLTIGPTSLNDPTTTVMNYLDGGITQTIGPSTFPQDTLIDLDIRILLGGGTTGLIQVFINGSIIFDTGGIDTSSEDVFLIELGSPSDEDGTIPFWYSEFVVGIGNESNTIQRRVYSSAVIADSVTNNSWFGNFSDVNSTITDGSGIYTETSGNRHGFFVNNIPFVERIDAVYIQIWGSSGSSGPSNINPSFRLDGVDGDINQTPLSSTYGFHEIELFSDPVTNRPWVPGSINSGEFGVISIT